MNSLLSATHTAEMDPSDQKDIIKKVKSSGKGDIEDTGDEEATGEESTDEVPSDEETPKTTGEEPAGEEAPETGGEEVGPEEGDDENLFEMSLNDYRAQQLISIYDNSSDEVKQMLNRLVTLNSNASREDFLSDLESDIDKEDLEYIFSKLEEIGINVKHDNNNELLEKMFEGLYMLENPPKNNMFQEGSNEILEKADRCTRIAKRKYKVWPSAYASGAVVKCRQGKIWKGVSEAQLDEMEELDTLKEKWSEKYKRSIDCNNPKGFSQKAHCQGRKKHE